MSDTGDMAYPELRDDQIVSIGIYGEMVAAYRYTVLSEKVPGEADRRMFAAIADEEQGHKQRLQRLLKKHFPDRSFYLSEEDKALVVAGPRLINVRDLEDYREVMQLALDTEIMVSRFYAAMSTQAENPDIRRLCEQLAAESAEHHAQLAELARQRGFLPPEQ